MMDPDTHLFFTAQDADTDGEEGKILHMDKKLPLTKIKPRRTKHPRTEF